MNEDRYTLIKKSLLDYMREIFEEIEESVARSHEEKYALLEDSLESASDEDELKVAFEQWYSDYAEELALEYELEELWDNAVVICEEKI